MFSSCTDTFALSNRAKEMPERETSVNKESIIVFIAMKYYLTDVR
jgi:hypothetical protein